MQLDSPDFSSPNRPIWSSDDVTQKLGEVYAQESSEVDPVMMQMQIASLPNDDW